MITNNERVVYEYIHANNNHTKILNTMDKK